MWQIWLRFAGQWQRAVRIDGTATTHRRRTHTVGPLQTVGDSIKWIVGTTNRRPNAARTTTIAALGHLRRSSTLRSRTAAAIGKIGRPIRSTAAVSTIASVAIPIGSTRSIRFLRIIAATLGRRLVEASRRISKIRLRYVRVAGMSLDIVVLVVLVVSVVGLRSTGLPEALMASLEWWVLLRGFWLLMLLLLMMALWLILIPMHRGGRIGLRLLERSGRCGIVSWTIRWTMAQWLQAVGNARVCVRLIPFAWIVWNID